MKRRFLIGFISLLLFHSLSLAFNERVLSEATNNVLYYNKRLTLRDSTKDTSRFFIDNKKHFATIQVTLGGLSVIVNCQIQQINCSAPNFEETFLIPFLKGIYSALGVTGREQLAKTHSNLILRTANDCLKKNEQSCVVDALEISKAYRARLKVYNKCEGMPSRGEKLTCKALDFISLQITDKK